MEDSMSTLRNIFVAPLSLLMMMASPVFADQRQAVEPSQLATVVGQHAAKQDADRAALREALARPEVKAVAGKLGLDMKRATAAVETMSGADLIQAANAAGQVNQQFVGGASTVTISTTTIIIALLIIILIIVAVD